MNPFDFSLGSPLKVGDAAPDLSVLDQDGGAIDLKTLYAQGDVLFFFFPMAETSGCTAQACSMRNPADYSTGDHDVKVLGVSSDSPEKMQRFKKHERLPYPLLPDTTHVIAKAFGVPWYFGLVARQSFLVRNGKIAWRTLSAGTSNHAEQVKEALAQMG